MSAFAKTLETEARWSRDPAVAEDQTSSVADEELFGVNVEAEKTSNELRIAQTKLGEFLDLIPAGLLIHQVHAIIFANSEAGRLIGIPSELLIGHHIFDFIDDSFAEMVRESFGRCFKDSVTVRSLNVQLVDIGGHKKVIQLSMSRLFWEGLPVINIVFNDITELKRKEQELIVLSTTDSLTGAYNRRYFMEAAGREFQRFQRYKAPVSLMVLDIDYFKRINDTFGHGVGDQAIKALVEACQGALRREDVLGRTGGEEFAVLLPETGLEAAATIAERLRRLVRAIVLDAAGRRVTFSVSVGVTQVVVSDATLEASLNRADRALYEAKATGRDRVVVEA